jgi:branched-chain amino acid transport system substrate-binding protein
MRTIFILIAAIACVSLSIFLLTSRGPAAIRIAIAGPVTGKLAGLGEQMPAGARQAVADINEAGGVLGGKIRLIIGDDQCDSKQAVAVANKLVAQEVLFVAGYFCSSSSIPAAKVYEEEAIPMISPASTSPALTEHGQRYIFRVAGRDDQQGVAAGQYLAEHYAGKRIAIVHDKSAYGKGIATETRRSLRAAGGAEVMFEAYTAGDKDFTALVSRIKQAGADVLFVGGYHPEAGLIVRQMRDQGLEPEGYSLYTYAAIQAWAQAAEQAGSTAPDKVARALRGMVFSTVIGRFTFDDKGDVSLPPYAIYRWSRGRYQPIHAPEIPGSRK